MTMTQTVAISVKNLNVLLKRCVFFAAVLFFTLHLFLLPSSAQEDEAESSAKFSFIVAGHAYGTFEDVNIGLYPKFLQKLNQLDLSTVRFVAFTGDIVRVCNKDSWEKVRFEMSKFLLDYKVSMGNHDYEPECIKKAVEQYGSTYYTFDIERSRFIILDTQEEPSSISRPQVAFLERQLESLDEIDSVFIFLHEPLWVGKNPRYKYVAGNSRSLSHKLGSSNYWKDVHGLLLANRTTNFYVIAGDTGHKFYSTPAFYDKIENITFILSGMGGVPEENFLVVTVADSTPSFSLVPLNKHVKAKPLEYYSLSRVSSRSNYELARAFEEGRILYHKNATTRLLILCLIALGLLTFYLMKRRLKRK